MFYLNEHFRSKNPFKKKFEDREALQAVYMDTINPHPKPFSLKLDDCGFKISYDPKSILGRSSRQHETYGDVLGKRVVKDYFDGIDMSIYSRKKHVKDILTEKYQKLETWIDHKEYKEKFLKESKGREREINPNVFHMTYNKIYHNISESEDGDHDQDGYSMTDNSTEFNESNIDQEEE